MEDSVPLRCRRPLILTVTAISVGIALFLPQLGHTATLDIWWPVEGARVSGLQPFKGIIPDTQVDKYTMTWQVDGGQPVSMVTNWEGYPHKEAAVDLTGWSWRGEGPYSLRFQARDAGGNLLAERAVNIYNSDPALQPPLAPTTKTSGSTTTSAQEMPPQVRAVAEVTTSAPSSSATLDIWWPVDGVTVTGVQPFKAMLQDWNVTDYDLYWQVDGDRLNPVPSTYQDYPHKEALVDLSGWNWKGSGPYRITYIAKSRQGKILAEKSFSIFTGAAVSAPLPAPIVNPPTTESVALSNPTEFYLAPNSSAEQQANAWRQSRPADAALMDKIASQPKGIWLGGWNQDVRRDVDNVVSAATGQGKSAVFIAYNIPQRDCGSYSAGGAGSPEQYRAWIQNISQGIGSRKALVVLEPDALANYDCLSNSDRQTRIQLLRDAIVTLKGNSQTKVYLDAGHPAWIPAGDMALRLSSANVGQADGFALNVSNFYTTSENLSYGQVIAQATGKRFVIDTSRNARGSNGEWCNPWGRGLGQKPTTQTGNSSVDAYLWLKTPGESDGWCNGGPSAGTWWPEYALDLARNASW